jgi:hypothetical protein
MKPFLGVLCVFVVQNRLHRLTEVLSIRSATARLRATAAPVSFVVKQFLFQQRSTLLPVVLFASFAVLDEFAHGAQIPNVSSTKRIPSGGCLTDWFDHR